MRFIKCTRFGAGRISFLVVLVVMLLLKTSNSYAVLKISISFEPNRCFYDDQTFEETLDPVTYALRRVLDPMISFTRGNCHYESVSNTDITATVFPNSSSTCYDVFYKASSYDADNTDTSQTTILDPTNACDLLDSDYDGVPDIDDTCPDEGAGNGGLSSDGCPILDDDFDGVSNENDLCANTFYGQQVDSTGCIPDDDGDGIDNSLDTCPNTPSNYTVTNDGCPKDTDNDGVNDAIDSCSGTPINTSVLANGCPMPDSDNDGVPDLNDSCPNVGGTVDSTGCPLDTDGDGVIDENDACPNENTNVNSIGCTINTTDSDGDGVLDDDDLCPQSFNQTLDGCPFIDPKDRDKDGIPIPTDLCPNLPSSEPNGCPAGSDSDGDGLPDFMDLCPNINGSVYSYGCPQDASDYDGDGVPDDIDRCSIDFGTAEYGGCPPIDCDNTCANVSDESKATCYAGCAFSNERAKNTASFIDTKGECAPNSTYGTSSFNSKCLLNVSVSSSFRNTENLQNLGIQIQSTNDKLDLVRQAVLANNLGNGTIEINSNSLELEIKKTNTNLGTSNSTLQSIDDVLTISNNSLTTLKTNSSSSVSKLSSIDTNTNSINIKTTEINTKLQSLESQLVGDSLDDGKDLLNQTDSITSYKTAISSLSLKQKIDGFNLSFSSSSCVAPSFEIPIYNKVFTMSAYCTLFSQVYGLISSIFTFIWSFMAIRVFLSA